MRHRAHSALLLFGIFVSIAFLVAPFFLGDHCSMDEIWNYQFARRVLYGYIPYKDFDFVVLPLSAQLNALPLFLLSDNLIVMRLAGIIVSAMTGTMLYLVCRCFKVTATCALLSVSMFIFLVSMRAENNYSWHAVMFLTMALLAEALHDQYKMHRMNGYFLNLLTGFFLGLTTITKQNIGIAAYAGSMIFSLIGGTRIFVRKGKMSAAEEKMPHNRYSIICKTLGWGIVVVAELLHLYDEAALGIFLKSHLVNLKAYAGIIFIPYMTLFLGQYEMGLKILALLPPLLILAAFLLSIYGRAEESRNLLLVGIYSLANFSIVYPTSDATHLLFAFPLSLVIIALLLNKNKASRTFSYLQLVLIAVVISNSLLQYSKLRGIFKHDTGPDIAHYLLIPFAQKSKQQIKEVINYLLNAEKAGKRVFIVDYRAALYMIPIDNFEPHGETLSLRESVMDDETKVIRLLSGADNSIVLIRGRNSAANWLEHDNFIPYIRNNMNHVSSIGCFDVFEKPPKVSNAVFAQ